MNLFKTIGMLAGFTISTTFSVENMRDQPNCINIRHSQCYEPKFIDVLNDYEDPMEDTNETLDVMNNDEDLTEYEYDAITALYNPFIGLQEASLELKKDLLKIGANFRLTDLIVREDSILDLNGFSISAQNLQLKGKIINSGNRDAIIYTPRRSISVPAYVSSSLNIKLKKSVRKKNIKKLI